MERAIRKTDEEWSRLSEEMHRSGQANKRWCAQHGINVHSLKDWEYRQKRKKQAKANNTELPPIIPTGWIAVGSPKLSNQNEQVSLPPSEVNVIEIQIGSCVVKVSPDFDDLSLTKVCEVLLKLC
jgi:hypothetical protein